jgi:hypothetical protein
VPLLYPLSVAPPIFFRRGASIRYDGVVPDNLSALAGRIRVLRQRLASAVVPPDTREIAETLALVEETLAEVERERDSAARGLDDMEARLLAIENSRLLRAIRWPGRMALDWRGRLAHLLGRTHSRSDPAGYARWLERERATAPPPEWFAGRQSEWKAPPLFSLVTALDAPKRPWLQAAADSLRAQFYPRWEWCAAGCSGEPWAAEVLAGAGAHVISAPPSTGAAAALNRAAAMAHGEYLVFAGAYDLLAPSALHYAAEAAIESGAGLIYADEDRLAPDGARQDPVFKPAWSPELLLGCPYLGHFLVVRRDLFEAAGGFREEREGAHEFDLALRLAESPLEVRHIPRVLLHRRGPDALPDAAVRAAVADALARRGAAGTVEDGPLPGSCRVRRCAAGAGRASVVICSRNEHLARRCLRALDRGTAWREREVVLVEHGARMRLEEFRLTRVPYDGPFNFARMNDLAVRAATGDWLVFLNDDVVPLSPDWMDRLAAHVARPEVGAAGATLLYPSGAIQHAGIATGMMTGTGHPQRDTFGSPLWPWSAFTREVSAVTGACLAMRREVFERLGGFDEQFPVNFNDVDLCLRARREGLLVVHEPAAVLRHDECRTRAPGIRWHERELWRRKWPGLAQGIDPYYSPHLSLSREDASLREDEPADWNGNAR